MSNKMIQTALQLGIDTSSMVGFPQGCVIGISNKGEVYQRKNSRWVRLVPAQIAARTARRRVKYAGAPRVNDYRQGGPTAWGPP